MQPLNWGTRPAGPGPRLRLCTLGAIEQGPAGSAGRQRADVLGMSVPAPARLRPNTKPAPAVRIRVPRLPASAPVEQKAATT